MPLVVTSDDSASCVDSVEQSRAYPRHASSLERLLDSFSGGVTGPVDSLPRAASKPFPLPMTVCLSFDDTDSSVIRWTCRFREPIRRRDESRSAAVRF